ncbi:Ribosomal RNA large subunit methyltransferase F [Shewanella sp. P1-14-1]|uniref:23S rRNA (adenine(1618)-N(6))-methyltransferase RlmF n=1 Tax=Shewanella sp. P1-14-1 TaxID=1723761 RepID=UPI0006D682C6|nr:23S rRNA (adenine(1618)-N(6))-methyltransferase RlmF [Shewanella sp. P1-14-1]KPZ71335.1 Ribosomal RNA large subunit methyltransferase F [Shewanella sp. P1-14-1]
MTAPKAPSKGAAKHSKNAKLDNKPVKSQRRQTKSINKHSKKSQQKITTGQLPPKALHPRNKHLQGYDFEVLIKKCPKLSHFVKTNPYGNLSIDFADPEAVKSLNAAILKLDYDIEHWDIPEGFLCPPVPGRVDYLHYIADLLSVNGKVPKGAKVTALDIGTGANGIYPLLGIQSYGWQFVASDIDPISISNVAKIAEQNKSLTSKLSLRLQANPSAIFSGIINADERFDLTMCNPPFHRSLEDATKGSIKKNANLAANRAKRMKSNLHQGKTGAESSKTDPKLNFGGQKAELWCEGGEQQFLANMIKESQQFGTQCLWFSSLISKSENLKPCYALLDKLSVDTVKTIEMQQGNKITRVLAWSFLTEKQREQWAKFRDMK